MFLIEFISPITICMRVQDHISHGTSNHFGDVRRKFQLISSHKLLYTHHKDSKFNLCPLEGEFPGKLCKKEKAQSNSAA